MHTLHLKAVDSRYASPEELDEARITPDQIPLDLGGQPMRLMAHQAATVRALRSREAAFVVNEAMTADGKSLAGLFQLFSEGEGTFTMFPTNELANDQQRALQSLLPRWMTPRWAKRAPDYGVINAAKIDELQEQIEHIKRADALEMIIDNELVLTNPDIFNLIMSFGYNRFGVARDRLVNRLASHFPLFVFDEFHLFGAPQSAAVMIAVLLIQQLVSSQRPPRFLFLSATPQETLSTLAAKAGLCVGRISGEYQHGQAVTPEGYRRILQPATLTLHAARLEDWVREHTDDIILPFFRDHAPGARGVIIANGIATAYRVLDFLRGPCIANGIALADNTGATPRSARNLNADLLVATSTVDVGVDFRINFMVFESADAGSHIQRLGRLGRHTDNGAGNTFSHFEAHALLPSWIADGIAEEIRADEVVDRARYKQAVEKAFPPQQDFQQYVRKWAGVQAAHVLRELRKPEIRTQYAAIHDRVKEKYRILFPSGAGKYNSLLQGKQTAILQEVKSFRGGSPFMALVQQAASRPPEFMSYNLITLLLHGRLEYIPDDEADALMIRMGQNVATLRRSAPLGVFRLHGWLPKPRPVTVYIDQELSAEQLAEQVIELKGVRLDAADVPGMRHINRKLEARTLPTLLTPDEPESLRRKLRLGYQIEMFTFTSIGEATGTAVFGRDALLLDSVLWRKKPAASAPDNPFFA